jgi:hypothetical protein
MDLDEAANDTGEADEQADEAPEEEFGLKFDFGPKPLAKLLRLSVAERLKWLWGSPLPPSEMAHRIMTTLDTDKKGSLPLSALDFILKQIQGQLSLSKETFDLAEVCSAPPFFSLSTTLQRKLGTVDLFDADLAFMRTGFMRSNHSPSFQAQSDNLFDVFMRVALMGPKWSVITIFYCVHDPRWCKQDTGALLRVCVHYFRRFSLHISARPTVGRIPSDRLTSQTYSALLGAL